MPKILSVKSRYKRDSYKTNIFQNLWDWFSSQDIFVRYSSIFFIFIFIIGILTIGVVYEFTSHASTINPSLIEDFSTGTGHWVLDTDSSDGGSGTLGTAVSYDNSVAADVQFNFGTQAQWISLNWNGGILPNPPSGSAASLGYYVKYPGGVSTRLIIVDSGGWRYTYQPERPIEATDPTAWFEQVVKLDAPKYIDCASWYINASACTPQTNTIQWPVKNMLIQVFPHTWQSNFTNQMTPSGDMYIDTIQWVDTQNVSTISRDIDPATSPIPVSANQVIFSQYGILPQGDIATGVSWTSKTKGEIGRRDIFWDTIETSPGVYNFTNADTDYHIFMNAGMKLNFLLSGGNPLYDANNCTNVANNGHDDCPITTTAEATAFANFAAASAKHYLALDPNAPSHLLFELESEPYNQPNFTAKQYAYLESLVVSAIKNVNPNFIVISGSTAENPQYFRDYLSSITGYGGEHADALSAHYYRQDIPETVTDDFLFSRSYLASRGIKAQMWDTEWGYPTSENTAYWGFSGLHNIYITSQQSDPQGLQAKMDIRKTLTELGLGIPFAVVYKLNDTETTGDYFGIMDTTFTPKKAFTAYTTLASQVTGYQLLGILPTQLTNLHILKFANSQGGKLLVLWADGGGQNITVNFPSSSSQIVDYLGNTQANASSVSVGDSPLYIKFGTPAPTIPPTSGPTATPAPPTPTKIPPTPTVIDTAPPVVSITSPFNGTAFTRRSTLIITASASDDTRVTQVVFFVNGLTVCTDTTYPYICSWSFPGKPGIQYTLTAKATDAYGYYQISNPVIVSVK